MVVYFLLILVIVNYSLMLSGEHLLFEYEDEIVKKLTKPQNFEGLLLLVYVSVYNEHLKNELKKYMRNKTKDGPAVKLLDQNGPMCLQNVIDETELKRVYRWTDDDIHILYTLLSDTWTTWAAFLSANTDVDFRNLPTKPSFL